MLAKFRPQAFFGLAILGGICGAAIYYEMNELAGICAGGIISIITLIVKEETG